MHAITYKTFLFSKVCCTCLLIEENSNETFIQFITNSEQTSIREKFYMCCPELNLSIYSKIILCLNCLERINIIKQFECQQKSKETIKEHKFPEMIPFQYAYLNSIKNEIKTEEIDLSDKDWNLNVKVNSANNLEPYIFNAQKVLKCSQGGSCFVDKNCLIKHLYSDTDKEPQESVYVNVNRNNLIMQKTQNSYKCFHCNYNNVNRKLFVKHMHNHIKKKVYNHVFSQGDEKLYKCLHCTYCCSVKSGLIVHMRTHSKEKPFKCSECMYSGSQKIHLIVHMRTHTREKLFKCSQCAYSSNKKYLLIVHIRNHTKEKPFKCPECAHCSSRKSSLIVHMRTHSKEKPFKCSQCSYCSNQKFSLIEHMRIHTKEKLKCSQCMYYTNFRSNLIRHMHTHNAHMHIHAKEKPNKCSQCTYCSTGKSNLIVHMRTHSKERPFKCSDCTYCSSQKIQLIVHMRTHTKKKPYKCP